MKEIWKIVIVKTNKDCEHKFTKWKPNIEDGYCKLTKKKCSKKNCIIKQQYRHCMLGR